MTFSYEFLSLELHSTADAAIKWFSDNWGISVKQVKVEQQIHPDVALRPIFHVLTHDCHTLCIEVSDSIYPKQLHKFILDCFERCLPVKLFVAIPKGLKDPDFVQKLTEAKRVGVGLIEVDDTSGNMIQSALSLSLMALRPSGVSHFPPKYRQSLSQAEHTFRDGEPGKGCSLVYDEIEGLFRKITQRCYDRGWWPKPPKMSIRKGSWEKLIENWDATLDREACKCPGLNRQLAGSLLGITPHRNDAGHKPDSTRALIKRDSELRTRFESAVDLLRDLILGSKPLRP